MTINNKITVNNSNGGNNVTDEKNQQSGPTFNAQSESGEIKQAMKIVEGDEVAGNKDQSQGKVDNTGATIEGGQTNTSTNIQAGGNVAFIQAEKEFFDKLIEEAGGPEPMARSIPTGEPEVVGTVEGLPAPDILTDEDFEALPEVEFDNGEDHPQAVYGAIQNFRESEVVPSVEEQKGLFQRAFSCCKKYATSDAAKALAETAAGAIEVVAGGLPFPANLSVFLLKKVSGN